MEQNARRGLLGTAAGAVNALMDRRLGHPPLATLAVNEVEIGGSALDEKIQTFLSDLRDATDRA
ncbi:MAG: hypothetical protein ACX93P_11200 [Roseovarius sp.]